MRFSPAVAALAAVVLASALPAEAQVIPRLAGVARVAGPVRSPVHPELYRLWETLPGRYESSGDGESARVRVFLRAVRPDVLFLEARTITSGTETLERGYIHLTDASPSYVSAARRFALSYQPETLGADFSCTLYGTPAGEGVTFESEGSDCSFPLRRPVSSWKIDTSRNQIAVRTKSGASTILMRIP